MSSCQWLNVLYIQMAQSRKQLKQNPDSTLRVKLDQLNLTQLWVQYNAEFPLISAEEAISHLVTFPQHGRVRPIRHMDGL